MPSLTTNLIEAPKVNATSALQTSGIDRVDVAGNLLNIPNIIGVVLPFAGVSPPTGWLLCYGQTLDTADYPALFAVIAYTYGGTGTSFNLPDMRGRVAVGKDNMGGYAANRMTTFTANTLGQSGGVDKVTLTAAESGLPAHNHTLTDPGHTHTGSSAPHSHGVVDPGHAHTSLIGYEGSTTGATGNNVTNYIDYKNTSSNMTNISIASTTVSVSVASRTTGITLSSNASESAAAAHTNTQPSIILNYIIKY